MRHQRGISTASRHFHTQGRRGGGRGTVAGRWRFVAASAASFDGGGGGGHMAAAAAGAHGAVLVLALSVGPPRPMRSKCPHAHWQTRGAPRRQSRACMPADACAEGRETRPVQGPVGAVMPPRKEKWVAALRAGGCRPQHAVRAAWRLARARPVLRERGAVVRHARVSPRPHAKTRFNERVAAATLLRKRHV